MRLRASIAMRLRRTNCADVLQRDRTRPSGPFARGIEQSKQVFERTKTFAVADNYEAPGICNESARIPVLNQEGSQSLHVPAHNLRWEPIAFLLSPRNAAH